MRIITFVDRDGNEKTLPAKNLVRVSRMTTLNSGKVLYRATFGGWEGEMRMTQDSYHRLLAWLPDKNLRTIQLDEVLTQ